MSIGLLSFTLSDGTSTAEPKPYKISPVYVNPLNNQSPTSGSWSYFLHYYSNTNGKPDVLTCTTNNYKNPNQVVYVCAFAQGGAGGKNVDVSNQPYGGGGGGGQCDNRQLSLPVTVYLNPIGQSTKCSIDSPVNSVRYSLKPGSKGTNGSNTTTIAGGSGGNGGGAGGNGGSKGSVSGATDGAGGNAGLDSGNGFTAYNGTNFIASDGNGYPGSTSNPFNFVSTKQIFADGTSANLASGGIAGYYNTSENTYYNGQSGNLAGVMFYFKY